MWGPGIWGRGVGRGEGCSGFESVVIGELECLRVFGGERPWVSGSRFLRLGFRF